MWTVRNERVKRKVMAMCRLKNLLKLKGTEKVAKKNPTFSCEICDQHSRTKYLNIIHINTKHKGFYFLCPINGCENAIKTRPGVQSHIQTKHPEHLEKYLKKCLPDLVTRPIDNVNGKVIKYVITQNEVGSPRLVKCKNKVNGHSDSSDGQNSSSDATIVDSTSEDTSVSEPIAKCAWLRTTRSSQQKEKTPQHLPVSSDSNSSIVSRENKDAKKREKNASATDFSERYNMMYQQFSPDLKASADSFSFLKNVDKDTVESQKSEKLGKCKTSRKLEYPSKSAGKYGTTKYGTKKKSPQENVRNAEKFLVVKVMNTGTGRSRAQKIQICKKHLTEKRNEK